MSRNSACATLLSSLEAFTSSTTATSCVVSTEITSTEVASTLTVCFFSIFALVVFLTGALVAVTFLAGAFLAAAEVAGLFSAAFSVGFLAISEEVLYSTTGKTLITIYRSCL